MQVAAALSILLSVTKPSSSSRRIPLLPPADGTLAPPPSPPFSTSSSKPPECIGIPGSCSCSVRNIVLTMALRMKLHRVDRCMRYGTWGARRTNQGGKAPVPLRQPSMMTCTEHVASGKPCYCPLEHILGRRRVCFLQHNTNRSSSGLQPYGICSTVIATIFSPQHVTITSQLSRPISIPRYT